MYPHYIIFNFICIYVILLEQNSHFISKFIKLQFVINKNLTKYQII